MLRVLILALYLALAALPAGAQNLLPGTVRAPFNLSFTQPPQLVPGAELRVTGSNDHKQPLRLVLRLDDGLSFSYATRVNEERFVPVGPFELRLPLHGLRTPSGRLLDMGDLRRLIIFPALGQPAPLLQGVTLEQPVPLPGAAFALDLGPADGPVFPGLTPVDPSDPRLHGRNLQGIRRPGGDALLADGILGIEWMTLPAAAGRWQVTLWTEDLGEWELLPVLLRQRIRLNGRTIVDFRRTPEQWLREVYLGGGAFEALRDGDAWEVIGQRRGGRVTAEVEVGTGGLMIELAGDRQATYLAAVVVEPAGGQAWRQVEATRAARFRSLWRSQAAETRAAPRRAQLWQVPFGAPVTPASRPQGRVRPVVAAPGTWATLEFLALAPQTQADARFEATAPAGWQADLRAAQWQFERPNTAATELAPRPTRLRAEPHGLGLAAGLPRRLVLRLAVPADARRGLHGGKVEVVTGDGRLSAPFEVEVVAASLPTPDVPIGVYLNEPAHFRWFKDMAGLQDQAAACDLDRLADLGLTGVAAPTPDPFAPDATAGLVAALARARDAGFRLPILDYRTAKRLEARLPTAEAAARLIAAGSAVAAAGLPLPLWSVADEPSNPGGTGTALEALAAALHSANPSAKLAGQLNAPGDRTWLPHLDVALVNSGFGVDGRDIANLRALGVAPWFYNMGDYRLAAGFYLWRVGAEGYLQWHARMPTADPFDPTDGREGDVQFLYPSVEPCPARPDLHADLLLLNEGILDLRWLRWLEGQAARSAEAARLLRQLRTDVPDRWAAARARAGDLDRWRGRITDLARRLQ